MFKWSGSTLSDPISQEMLPDITCYFMLLGTLSPFHMAIIILRVLPNFFPLNNGFSFFGQCLDPPKYTEWHLYSIAQFVVSPFNCYIVYHVWIEMAIGASAHLGRGGLIFSPPLRSGAEDEGIYPRTVTRPKKKKNYIYITYLILLVILIIIFLY